MVNRSVIECGPLTSTLPTVRKALKRGYQRPGLHYKIQHITMPLQGLELDWACVTWDADFRYSTNGWEHWSFCGYRWNHIKKKEPQNYLKNAYRVLLTRARQGMVIVVPPGDWDDLTRNPAYYDQTFGYLKDVGFTII